jgi:hypothetical protein
MAGEGVLTNPWAIGRTRWKGRFKVYTSHLSCSGQAEGNRVIGPFLKGVPDSFICTNWTKFFRSVLGWENIRISAYLPPARPGAQQLSLGHSFAAILGRVEDWRGAP